MNLRNAILISFIGHTIIFLAPLGHINLWIFPSAKSLRDVQVTYYQLKPLKTSAEATKPTPTSVPEAAAAKEEKSAAKAVEIPDTKEQKSQIINKTKPDETERPREKPAAKKEKIIPASIPGTTLPNTPQGLNYYHFIRGEIRRALEKNYRAEYGEGEVAVSFALNQAGELISLKVVELKSSANPQLYKLAYEGIKGISQFRGLPKGLLSPQISFNLTVVFKKK